MNVFGFIADIGNYADRVVGRDDFDWGFVSTAKVSDGKKPYETAVKHHSYGDGKMVIAESYDSKEEAAAGHLRWVATMTSDKLPDRLVECNNSGLASLCSELGADLNKSKNELN